MSTAGVGDTVDPHSSDYICGSAPTLLNVDKEHPFVLKSVLML